MSGRNYGRDPEKGVPGVDKIIPGVKEASLVRETGASPEAGQRCTR